MSAHEALLAVTAVHLGFQLTVTAVVYPALAEVGDDDWSSAHEAHSRRIVRLVVPLYAALLGTCVWTLLDRSPSTGTVVAVVATSVALVTTGLVAAPAHGRLGRLRTAAVVQRLLAADRVRTAAAAVSAVGALLA
ncbi:MAG: hypothetical protein EON52_13015 [Actinomycetales bacterium]|nr:MAG: hypothetical protein EON52_13015 [Actinomycetales bacterium]